MESTATSTFIDSHKGPSVNNIDVGLPAVWNVDKYGVIECKSKDMPKFLDGYFLCQLSASWGDANDPAGQKLDHMIDAYGAVGSFRIKDGKVTFSAQYYPSKPYKIWEFYNRDMKKSSVPFYSAWSYYNLTLKNLWDKIPSGSDMAAFHSNVDFWKISNRTLGVTEAPWIGYEFDIHTLTDFKLFQFVEDNQIFNNPKSTITPLMNAIHEHKDEQGIIWAAFSAIDFVNMHCYQGVFTVDGNGVRRVEGLFDYGKFNYSDFDANMEYKGDSRAFPGYLHSITATENYFIIPVTSVLFNPLKLSKSPSTVPNEDIQKGEIFQFYDSVPLRFLIFNKKSKKFVTQKPIEANSAMFISHQLNAYEIDGENLVADMLTYPNADPYFKYLFRDYLTTQLYPAVTSVTRFKINLANGTVTSSVLTPQPTMASDFSQINHAFLTKRYTWGYIVDNVYAVGNSILKLNVNEPSGRKNLTYQAEENVNLHEPFFVAKPNSVKEDDGILMVRGLNVKSKTSILYILDAQTMKEIGRSDVPIPIPLGFHNKFFIA